MFSWVILYPGHFMVDCGDSDTGGQRACVRDEFADAFDIVQELSDSLETIRSDESERARKAEVVVSDAEDALRLRRDALEDYLADVSAEPDALLVESRERAIEAAEASLLDAEDALADLTRAAADADIRLADREIELAEARLADAEDALAALLEDPDPVDEAVKLAAVVLARESLAEAEDRLEEYDHVDGLEVALRQAELVSARARWKPPWPTWNAPRCARLSTASWWRLASSPASR